MSPSRYILAFALLATTPAIAANPSDYGATFKCLGPAAAASLLPATGYTDIKKLGEQKGVIYFDAMHRHKWYRVGVNSCSATVVFLKHEKLPAAS